MFIDCLLNKQMNGKIERREKNTKNPEWKRFMGIIYQKC